MNFTGFRTLTVAPMLLLYGCVGNFLSSARDRQDAIQGIASTPSTDDLTGCSDIAFGRQVWGPVISSTCFGCHIQGGFAEQRGAQFTLADTTQPDYFSKNLASVRRFASMQVDGMPLLLAKPSGAVPHGGGQALPAGSSGYKALADFVAHDNSAQDCNPHMTEQVRTALISQTPIFTLRQAALLLVGRMPTALETQLANSGDMNAALDSVLADPSFDSYIHLIYNDFLLTDQFTADNAPLLWLIGHHNGQFWAVNGLYEGQIQSWGVTQNAPQMISYVIRNDRPYTEIVNGNYLMLNVMGACTLAGAGFTLPFSPACSSDHSRPANLCTEPDVDFSRLDSCHEFFPYVPTGSPVCGILNDATFLNVYQSTPSNVDRHRAAAILQDYLNLDIMSLGPTQSPTDKATTADPNFPQTLVDPKCVVCHQILDGVASSYRNWDYNVGAADYGFYSQKAQSPTMFSPSLFGKPMEPNSPEEPLCWLGRRIAEDPRFAAATVSLWFRNLTGNAVLSDPLGSDPNYTERLQAKLAQNKFLADVATSFAANNFRAKSMIKQLILSPYFQTAGVDAAADASTALQASSFGHAHRRGPEQMSRILNGVFGTQRYQGSTVYPTSSYLMNDFLISDGGIDSKSTIYRNESLNGISAAIASFVADGMSCQQVAFDFSQPASSRRLFPFVELITVPSDSTGESRIKSNIVHLHNLILGETLTADDPEVVATYTLWKNIYAAQGSDTTLAQACASDSITQDITHTLHPWMAVVNYLLQDGSFLYE